MLITINQQTLNENKYPGLVILSYPVLHVPTVLFLLLDYCSRLSLNVLYFISVSYLSFFILPSNLPNLSLLSFISILSHSCCLHPKFVCFITLIASTHDIQQPSWPHPSSCTHISFRSSIYEVMYNCIISSFTKHPTASYTPLFHLLFILKQPALHSSYFPTSSLSFTSPYLTTNSRPPIHTCIFISTFPYNFPHHKSLLLPPV